MKKKINKNLINTISLRLNSDEVDNEKKIISAALSSETEVKRWFGSEILVHSKDSINLERAAHGLPLLFNHDPTKPIGRVDEIRLDKDGKLRGKMSFSNNKLAEEIFRDVSEDFLNNVSIGYKIDEYVETDAGIRAEKWSLLEASIVSVPADVNAGINRNLTNDNEDLVMDKLEKDKLTTDAILKYKELQQKRKAEINLIFENHTEVDYLQLKTRALNDDDCTAENVRVELLELIGKNTSSNSHVSTFGCADEADKFSRGVEQALIVKVGSCRDDKIISGIRQNEFYSYSMFDLAKACLERSGIKAKTSSRMDIIGEALSMRVMQGVASFPGILENIAHGSMQMAYEEAEETWRTWAHVGSLQDFKLSSRPNLSAFDSLPPVPDTTEYTYGTFNDVNEHIQLATYGKLFEISRQALINDDLSGLGRIPAAMGRSAARTVGNLAYNVLTSNALMDQDALPIFDVAKDNDFNSLSGALDNAAIENIILKMALQKDPSGTATLGLFPAFLVVPTSLASTARVLMSAEYEPGTAPGNLMPNPHKGLMQVVSEHRLENDPDKHYYAIASQNVSETVEVAFLDGVDAPTLEQDDPFTRDGVTYKVRIDAAARALEFRGMSRTVNEPIV